MTEPRIRDQIAFAEAHALDLARMSGELTEAEQWIAGGSVLDRERARGRVERIAAELAQVLPVLARLWPPGNASEDTQPIILIGSEKCSRCAGTGEVPIVELGEAKP